MASCRQALAAPSRHSLCLLMALYPSTPIYDSPIVMIQRNRMGAMLMIVRLFWDLSSAQLPKDHRTLKRNDAASW